jgi:hypothetical protein
VAASKAISSLNIVVAGGKVSREVISDSTNSGVPRVRVSVLDDYATDRVFKISNPSYSTILEVASTYSHGPPQGSPFTVDFDIVEQKRSDKQCVVSLNIRSTKREDGKSVERICYWTPLGGGSLLEGNEGHISADFMYGLGNLEGSGDLFLYVTEGGSKEVPDVEESHGVKVYKTVSNVLRLPVRSE